jgi:hypothetical protein
MKTRNALLVATMLFTVGAARAGGFASPDDAARAVLAATSKLKGTEAAALAVGLAPQLASYGALGLSAAVLSVDHGSVATYNRGVDPAGLLHDGGLVFYPIVVGRNVMTGVWVRRMPDGWQPERIDGVSARAINGTRATAVAQGAGQAKDFFVVEVPSLGVAFVANRQGTSVKMRPVRDMPAAQLQAGTEMDAADVFERLVPFAAAMSSRVP